MIGKYLFLADSVVVHSVKIVYKVFRPSRPLGKLQELDPGFITILDIGYCDKARGYKGLIWGVTVSLCH